MAANIASYAKCSIFETTNTINNNDHKFVTEKSINRPGFRTSILIEMMLMKLLKKLFPLKVEVLENTKLEEVAKETTPPYMKLLSKRVQRLKKYWKTIYFCNIVETILSPTRGMHIRRKTNVPTK